MAQDYGNPSSINDVFNPANRPLLKPWFIEDKVKLDNYIKTQNAKKKEMAEARAQEAKDGGQQSSSKDDKAGEHVHKHGEDGWVHEESAWGRKKDGQRKTLNGGDAEDDKDDVESRGFATLASEEAP